MLRTLFFIFTCLSVLHNVALANEKSSNFNQSVSDWVDRRAKSLDLALAGDRFTDEKVDSTARINQEVYWRDYEGVKYKLDLDLDLALPNFEKKYKLMLSNYNRNKVRRSNYSRRQFREDTRSDYGATIAILRKIGNVDISFEPRIEIKDPIATFYTIRFQNIIKRKLNTFNTRFELFADSEKGTGQFLALSFRKDFFKHWSHYFVFEEEYRDAQNYYSNLFGYTLYYRINNSMSINQSFIFTANNGKDITTGPKSFHLDEIFIGPAFTHEIIPNEVEYTINYIHIFSEEYEYKGRSSVSFLLGLIF